MSLCLVDVLLCLLNFGSRLWAWIIAPGSVVLLGEEAGSLH